MSDLINRKAALDALNVTLGEGYAIAKAAPADRFLDGYLYGVTRAREIVGVLPHIGTCANCEHWAEYGETPPHTDGECCSRAYLHGNEPIFTKPDHFCAAWKARDNA